MELQPIIEPIPSPMLSAEVAALPPTAHLISRKKFHVYLAKSEAIPNILQEIGRLREKTFREVGEGTGKSLDLDEFDTYFHNLFIWDEQNKRIVGGYRVGVGDELYSQKGIDGFYINSLFKISEKAYPTLRQSIELGRSYIVADYQKAYLPFFLLWKGILVFLKRSPQYRYLIGPVSISKFYSDASRYAIIDFVKKHFYDFEKAAYFQARTPFEWQDESLRQRVDQIQGSGLGDLESFLQKIEPKHIKVPVLLKQYTKLNARFLSFNLDPNFSDALDGLMLLDLYELPQNILQLLEEK